MYRIMLADDEGIVTDSLKFIIEKEFGDMCLVQSAKTGRGAIELAETFSPDIIIMDNLYYIQVSLLHNPSSGPR